MTGSNVLRDQPLLAGMTEPMRHVSPSQSSGSESVLANAYYAGVDKVCDTRFWTSDMIDAWHRAMPDLPRAFQCLAAAIRAQTEAATAASITCSNDAQLSD